VDKIDRSRKFVQLSLIIIDFGGDEGARTPDLGVANAALSQLSYIPTIECLFISNPLSGVN
jgi:hypothetical protein